VAILIRDLRIAVRLLVRAPGFTTAALLTLALGIAANTAIFSVIYATFFEPLPYRDPDRLVMIWSQYRGGREMVSPVDFTEWQRNATAFDEVNAWGGYSANLATDDRPERINVGPATPGFLPMLGYGHPLALGRDFLDEEGTLGRDRVAILTHRLWQQRFGGDPGIVGRQIRLDRQPYTVVGVLGPGPADENQIQLWVPLAFTPAMMNREARWLLVMGRLRRDVTLDQANANLDAVNRAIAAGAPSSRADYGVSVEPFRNNFLSEDTKRGLWLLLVAVGFVLLIACANVANLLLVRGTSRQRELAIRASLGATRAQIVRQLIVESLLLAAAGGCLGVLLAAGVLQVVVALMPPYMLPTEAHVRLNIPVLLFTCAACGAAGLLCGAAPAWQSARADINTLLKESARATSGGSHRLRRTLVAAEFALAMTLLAGGGLAIASLFTLTTRDLGFRSDGLLTFTVPAEPAQFTATEQIEAFYRRLLERLQTVPGVVSASVSLGMPVLGPAGRIPFSVAGRPALEPPRAAISLVTPDYFRTFGLRFRTGRPFTEQDRAGSPPVAVVNETFVRRFLADVDPLSQRLVIRPPQALADEPGDPVEWQIVGVYQDVRNLGPANPEVPEINLSFWQVPLARAHVAIRTAGEPGALQQSVASVIHSTDPDLPIADVKTMDRLVADRLVRDRFNTALFGSFAAVGLALAAVGIYAVMSFVVVQRTREIGVRIALGASAARIVRQIIGEGMLTAGAGAAAGAVGAFYVVRAMRGLVTGVSEFNLGAFALVTGALLAAALIACAAPARRAASLDPIAALRQE
jgi:putative ABC transport system permease protein